MFYDALESHPGSVVFIKVKGHAKASDVAADLDLSACKKGNDAADALARKAAKCLLFEDACAEHQRIASLALSVQLFWVLVLCKRRSFAELHSPDRMSHVLESQLPQGVEISCSCSCKPSFRVRAKSKVCKGCCCLSSLSYGRDENVFFISLFPEASRFLSLSEKR